uniref:Dynein axonemal heavy chain 2 n=1 Tax=Ciona savignyi TaxID=51511 RepID=H2ZI86_CIOSA
SYVFRTGQLAEITESNFTSVVQWGTLRAGYLDSLLRIMNGIYAPLFFKNKSWPDSIKNDFSAQLHRFLASLTDIKHKMKGKTVLYIPNEGLDIAADVAAKNKELVQRLETAMIHWTRQIKEVLNAQDALETAESSGPLEEIDFWNNRCIDLSGLSSQLDKPGVKKIQRILEKAKSSYVGPFRKLAKLIQDGSAQAQSNLRFLSLFKAPCEKLATATPKDIPKLLPDIVKIIRVIWVNSDHYNTRERLTALFRKLSNEVIRICCREISLDRIFDGYVNSSSIVLTNCVDCCLAWKEIYRNSAIVHHNCSNEGWVLDQTSIFAQVDAFVQRCKDLLEVCECQRHFARRYGDKTALPCFAGQRGPSIARSLLEIEGTFEKHLQILRSVKKGILDVKNTSWHDDYNRFRTGMKDLEVMMQNLITSAFETVKTVEEGVMLLNVFQHLSAREAIKRTIDKRTVEVYSMFNDELNCVKKELSSKASNLMAHQPKYAGAAHWARALKRRIDRPMEVLKEAVYLPEIGLGMETRTAYQQLATALDEFVRKTFNDIIMHLVSVISSNMQVCVYLISHLCHISRSLLKLFNEIHYWERLMFEIPHYVNEVYLKREELRSLREHVLLVVRDYNRIISVLSPAERGLFKERIRSLDKKIHPGLVKLTWASKGISEFFVGECRLHSKKVQTVVDDYKQANMQIAQSCRKISELLLVHLDGKRIYQVPELEFQDDQFRHRNNVQKRLEEIHMNILQTMKNTYQVFKADGPDVQQQWVRYTQRMDQYVEDAFRLNIKSSLLEISKAINGDGKSTPNPLFRVKVVLQQGANQTPQLASIVRNVSTQLTTAIANFRRLPEHLARGKRMHYEQKEAIAVMIDEETRKVQRTIQEGMFENSKHLQNYLTTWDNYKEIWEINKDAFIRRYQRLNPPVMSFDADIGRYAEVSNNVQKEETVLNIEFVLLDCSPLKFALLSHCNEWQNKFTTLLKDMASQRLSELTEFLKTNAEKVSQVPKTLDELGDGLELWEKLHGELQATEQRIPPIHDQFGILEKYEVAIEEETQTMLESLGKEWVDFQQCIIDSETMLKKNKEKFKTGLLSQAEEFRKRVNGLTSDFFQQGPFSSQFTSPDAIEVIAQFKKNIGDLKLEEVKLRRGLGLFKIEQQPSKELTNLDKDLDHIDQVWDLTKNWETMWDEWKVGQFKDLITTEMEMTAQGLYKKLNKLSREEWEIVEFSKHRIEQFKRTMPLITDLKNDAMRERHWNQIKTEVQRPFDHQNESFTLERIIDLGLDAFSEKISEISGAASKELAIEETLSEIETIWTDVVLDIVPYKDKGHFKLRGTDEIFLQLEDHQVTLSTMKASRFVKAFEKVVDMWERALSLILECIEMILTVQRQWMYLENIFLGEDIRKQLPRESAEFDDVNSNWKVIMTRLNKDNNAKRLLEVLNDMNMKLEEIQKSLDMYLETKRQIFPRFYFLSNDDLLEILGQSRNPEAVQPHLKKCFDNIKSLLMKKVGHGNRMEASGMFSCEGEYVEFGNPVLLEGPVEAWLCDVEQTMRWTLKEVLKQTRIALKKMISKRDKWVKEWPGQPLITASQIQWTADCIKALITCKERQDKKALKSVKKKQVSMLNKYSEAIRGNLNKNQRSKVVALVTIEVHARDVIDKLIKTGTNDVTAFEWLQQLRVYWDKDIDDCVVRQTNTQFQYGYEYLGNSGRLVITPLTDRCYVTLTTALHLHRYETLTFWWPAGTGKTETVKDLGKALGMYVIVVNCSEGLDYKSMGRMYSGLAQTGAWGCFDEFNRINIEVLSVVAQQILSILSALSTGLSRFVFEGREISLIWSCYAGRTELPDNLKSMFRPIAMVVPDSNLISEIILFGEGFGNCRKVYTLYSLAIQQLSKQDHYDFGLRALVSVLRYAGRKKRGNPEMSDEEVILRILRYANPQIIIFINFYSLKIFDRTKYLCIQILLLAMKDMNNAKLTAVDLPLFNGIVGDLILTSSAKSSNSMRPRTPRPLSDELLGQSGAGKSCLISCIVIEQDFPINPKALSLGELYGEFDLSTNEWTDGVLSSVMRHTCADEKPDEKWMVFDGPVDTLWIESMNSVMDDNKVLTLINGERVSMPEQVRCDSCVILCLGDLSVASPATVSRCGMVYFDYIDLGYRPFIASWLQQKSKDIVPILQDLIDKYLDKAFSFKKHNCIELVPLPELNGVRSLCNLFDTLATAENGVSVYPNIAHQVNPSDSENFPRMVELWFLFSLIWSVGAAVDEDGRRKLDNFLRELEGSFPNKDTVYEYYVDPKSRSWVNFEEKLQKGWRYSPTAPFYRIMVPTVDTVRYDFLVTSLILRGFPVLLVGPVGTGKTSTAQNVLSKLDVTKYLTLTINMSSQTTSNNVQDIIESRVEKRTKGVYVPIGSKKMITFMDDFNMPAKDTFGSQPPLELIRQWIDYSFWYDRQKQITKHIKVIYSVKCFCGGRQVISQRLQTRFNLINMTFPSETQIKRIYGTMINQKLQDFEEDVKPIGDIITQATIDVYRLVVEKFLPTPAKIHYLFNLRDISKVFQGLLRAHKDFHDTKHSMTRLWIHECFRVFSDRLVDAKDTENFIGMLSDRLGALFDQTYHNMCPNKQPPLFGQLFCCDFLNTNEVYEDLMEFQLVKKYMEDQMEDYNMTPGVVPMDLVLFKDAIEHVARIIRVIRRPRGNILLIGIGGSGRQSLARLASYMCEYTTFQIEVSRHYRKQEFRDGAIKYEIIFIQLPNTVAGVENKPTVFLFNDTQVVEEIFLEDINNILSSGEVPNLYKPDEFEEVRNELEAAAKAEGIAETPDAMFKFLIDRVRNNLHLALCMSPVGELFRNRIRQYPAFVNCTTIDLFTEWPHDALLEVAEKYLEGLDLGSGEDMNKNVAQIFVTMHRSVVTYSEKLLFELKRHNYVTPTNYLELVSGYKGLLFEKRKELGDQVTKLRNGLFKIDDTRAKVEAMSIDLEQAKTKVAQFQKECEEYLVVIVQQKREADEQQKSVAAYSERIGAEEVKCKTMADNAQRDLDEAIPALEEAKKALEALNKKDITEIKSYGRPPALVEMVLQAVMILRGSEPTWAEAKRQLGDQNFIKQLVNFDKENMSDRVLKKIGQQYVAHSEFHPDNVGRVSVAAQSLCLWVRAMELFGRIYRVVEPKRQRLDAAMEQLKEKQASLAEAKRKLEEVTEKMENLKKQYEKKSAEKEELKRKAEETELKLTRAGKLVAGLAGEKIRWEATAENLEESMGYLVGDCLVASAFLSYMGPFLSNYRDEMVEKIWLKQVHDLSVPCSPNFTFANFLSKPTQTREWNLQGLPSDAFSTENGVIVTRGDRWPLMVDPQGQAIKWIKNMEGRRGLKIIDLQQHDYLRTLENSIQFGSPVLLQNVQEELDPSLAPILNKAITKVGGRMLIKLGDKEIEYNTEFKFYITTKLSNPHYAPEISTKTSIVNFAVKEQGLEAQLLGTVVRKERPELEEQKDSLVINIASGKNKLQELEDEILRLLNEAQGSLLDDEQLVNTLHSSKTISAEVSEQLQVSEQTERKIDAAREGYRPCAQRASILFFVLNDMGRIDPMYQFSLDSFIDLFNQSIDKSQKSPKLENRINNLNEYHTYAVYRYTCRGLFEMHKMLFSFQMCAKILESASKINMDEYNFFLRGGVVLDREGQMDNPCPNWLADSCWDNITELDKLTNFHGIMTSFEQYPRDWNVWFTSPEPETAALPGEWENSCNELQRMVIVRSLRSDRVSFCATSFIVNNLGSKFVEPPVLDMKQVVDDSTPRSPLIFVLSPGVDPTSGLLQLAEQCEMAHRFHALSLGQGQAPIATRMIKEGVKDGNWVFLANCHLSLSWMPQLDKLVEQLQVEEPHGDFRLWLSSSPHPDFPISILQVGIKMTTEPPKGLKANMKRLYHLIQEPQFTRCTKPAKYKKLLFSLCFFHSLLIERKKFLMLGWNIIYGFNDSDFEV